jgi:GWxTD domain-containing protein
VLRRRTAGALLLGFSTVLVAGKPAEDLRKWIDGPVRYIANKEEVQAFHALETDQARTLSVEQFWARRDPTPDTLANEYRQRFWERVKEANDTFLDSSKPGWLTDRGKIHILYGPPTEVQDDRRLQPNDSPTSGQGVVRWIYEGRPAERMDVDPVVVVPFVRSVDGEYRLSYEPKLANVFWDPLAIAEDRTRAFDKYLEMTSSATTSELSVMLDLGRMQEVPPQERVLIESVETMESYRTLSLDVRIDRYVTPEEHKPLAVVNVDLSHLDADAKPAIMARFTPVDATRAARLLGEDSFGLATTPGHRLAQARIALDPGAYAVTVIVVDPKTIQTGIHRTRVELEAPPSTLRLSDPVWASDLAPVEYASLASYTEPFHVGPFKLVPKLDAEYRRGEPIRLFFEVYGATFPVSVSFQLEGQENDGRWVRLRAPQTSEQRAPGVAWELATTERWPLGDYRVRVVVKDAGEKAVATDVPFRLAASSTP